jgi:AAA domain
VVNHSRTRPSAEILTKVFWHGEDDYRSSRPYLVQHVIPEIGHGLESGQWGTFKTFAAIDLAHSCMSGEAFLGYEIRRPGGVVFIALEGTDEVPIRLQAVIEDRGKFAGPAPFAWIETCPPLLGKKAADEMCKVVEQIRRRLQQGRPGKRRCGGPGNHEHAARGRPAHALFCARDPTSARQSKPAPAAHPPKKQAPT